MREKKIFYRYVISEFWLLENYNFVRGGKLV